MAMHLSIGRIRSVSLAVPLAVSLVALVGLAVVAGAVYLPIHPGPEVEPGLQVETAPEPGSASVAPQPLASELALPQGRDPQGLGQGFGQGFGRGFGREFGQGFAQGLGPGLGPTGELGLVPGLGRDPAIGPGLGGVPAVARSLGRDG